MKSKNIVLYTIILLLELIFQACKKTEWYDVKSDKNLAIPASLKDIQALLDNANLFNSTSSLTMSEVSSDAFYYSVDIEDRILGYERNAYTWSKESSNTEVGDWSNLSYGNARSIYVANLVLEINDKIPPVNETEEQLKTEIKGQALFFRSVAFFEWSQQFAPPYDESTKDEKMGIPLRLESDINVKSVRSTVGETYLRIVEDLKTAGELLPLTQPSKTQPGKVAAWAMLARVYLSMSNYTEAAKYAQMALNEYNFLLDYKTLDLVNTSSPFQPYNSETIFYRNFSGGSYFYIYYIFAQKSLYDLYDDNDLRKRTFYTFDPATNIVTFRGTYAGESAYHFFSGLATDELYLIRAECYARAGKTIEALDDVNTLLKTRWQGQYTDITASSAEEALFIILMERKKELVLRGTRWSDLRRLNKDPRFVQTFTRTVGGKTYVLKPNSYQYTFPIPDDIIQMTGMEQNAGWQ